MPHIEDAELRLEDTTDPAPASNVVEESAKDASPAQPDADLPNGAHADGTNADGTHAVGAVPCGGADHAPGQVKVDELTAAVDRLADRIRADQDVIGRMQSRIESLQGHQVRALLGPAITELANLHAAFAESSERDYERLGLDRVRKEFTLLRDRLESAIDVLGATSVDARVGDPFDSRVHHAVRQLPTSDRGRDKTIAAIVRQGFTFDPNGKPALSARVNVHAYDPSIEVPDEPDAQSATLSGAADLPGAVAPSEVAPDADGELELPYHSMHSEDS